uniref:Uncharacterized protein n=1 Tax=Balaenoptera musculus TaxID=9771 RepID=A0A8C0DC29_BALMU
ERSLKFSTSDNCTFSKTPSARFLKTSFSDCQTSPGWTSALIGSQRFLLGSAVTIKKRTVSELPHPLLDLSKERVPDKEAIHSQEAKGTVLTEKAGFFPPVENLDPRERRRSTEPPEDWPSEEEIRRFWKLRQEIVGSEPAEVPESQRLPVELPPALKAVLRDKEMRRPRPRPVFRTRTPSFKSVLPELVPRQQALGRTSLPEESRVLALRELREKQAQLEQCRSPANCLSPPRSGPARPAGVDGALHLLVGFGQGGLRREVRGKRGGRAGTLCPARRSRSWVPAAPRSLTPGPRGGRSPSS